MGVTPSGLAERPVVHQEDRPYLDGFWALARGRAHGQFGPSPIPVTEVQAYLALVKECGVDERMKFLRLVQKMDTVYLEHAATLAESST